jgi:hypothetical protein
MKAKADRLVCIRVGRDIGELAALLGYDVIDVRSMGYRVILNRSILKMHKGNGLFDNLEGPKGG